MDKVHSLLDGASKSYQNITNRHFMEKYPAPAEIFNILTIVFFPTILDLGESQQYAAASLQISLLGECPLLHGNLIKYEIYRFHPDTQVQIKDFALISVFPVCFVSQTFSSRLALA